MPNKLFTQYKAEVSSFSLRESNQGIIEPGVYRGFDGIEAYGSPSGGNIPVKLNHGDTAFIKVHPSNESDQDQWGVMVFPNGMVYHDSDPDSFNIPFNHDHFPRYHLIYATLDYVQSPGASSVTYNVLINGYNNSTGTYTLPNPSKDIAIGFITIMASGTDIDSLSFIRMATPPLALGDILKYPNISALAFREQQNTFTQRNSFTGLTEFSGLTHNVYAQRNVTLNGLGYIIISDPFESQEFRLQLSNTTINVFGFVHNTKPFGTTPNSIRPGDSIKVTFVNVGEGSVFKRQTSGTARGFWGLSEDIPIEEGVLYTIRYEFLITGNAVFSLSPHIGQSEFKKVKNSIPNIITQSIDTGITQIQDLLLMVIDYNNYRLVTVTVLIRAFADHEVSGLIPPGYRPTNLVDEFIGEPGGSDYFRLRIKPNGDLLGARSGVSPLDGDAIKSVTYIC